MSDQSKSGHPSVEKESFIPITIPFACLSNVVDHILLLGCSQCGQMRFT
jgi:hypothetical protein